MFYGIYLGGGKKYIKNGEVDGPLKGYINDIKIDNGWTDVLINSGVASSMSVIIFGMFIWLNKHNGGQFVPFLISIIIILCLSVLYLKVDGVAGLIDGCKEFKKEHKYSK